MKSNENPLQMNPEPRLLFKYDNDFFNFDPLTFEMYPFFTNFTQFFCWFLNNIIHILGPYCTNAFQYNVWELWKDESEDWSVTIFTIDLGINRHPYNTEQIENMSRFSQKTRQTYKQTDIERKIQKKKLTVDRFSLSATCQHKEGLMVWPHSITPVFLAKIYETKVVVEAADSQKFFSRFFPPQYAFLECRLLCPNFSK